MNANVCKQWTVTVRSTSRRIYAYSCKHVYVYSSISALGSAVTLAVVHMNLTLQRSFPHQSLCRKACLQHGSHKPHVNGGNVLDCSTNAGGHDNRGLKTRGRREHLPDVSAKLAPGLHEMLYQLLGRLIRMTACLHTPPRPWTKHTIGARPPQLPQALLKGGPLLQ